MNSRTGSAIVKPNARTRSSITNTLFEKVEETLGIKKYSIKVGIMDKKEEQLSI